MTLKTHSIELNSMDNNHLSSLLPRTSNAGPSPIAAMTPSLRVANERRSPYELGSAGVASYLHPAAGNPLLHHPLTSVKSDANIQINLENAELWDEFHRIGTEMIITKLGRRMFPTLKVSVSGLDPNVKYFVLMDLMLADDSRFRFNAGWIRSGKAEPQWPSRIYTHPDSPATGAQWMKHEISFQKVKLTNNTMDQQGHLVLTSMHKYVPRIHVIPASDYANLHWGLPMTINTNVFQVCSFIAVTAYANDRMTQLKIDNNPFAKGFRENGQLRVKKRQLSANSTESVGKKVRPDSASSSHSSLNITDDESAATNSVRTDHSITPPPPPVKCSTNFSIARLVGDGSPVRSVRSVRTDPVIFPTLPWLHHHHPHHPHVYQYSLFAPRLAWHHLPIVSFPPYKFPSSAP